AAGDVTAPVAAAIFAATQGNPLFVDEVARLLAQQQAQSASAPVPIPIPFGVREAIRQRLRLVDDDTRALLEIAAVVGGADLRADVVASIAGVATTVVAAAIERAAHAGVLKDDGRRFAHALVAEVLASDLSPARRVELHRRAADVLAKLAAPPRTDIAL